MEDDSSFATVGVRHLKFWTVQKGRLSSQSALWGQVNDRNLACVAYHGAHCLTGTSKGRVIAWSSRRAIKELDKEVGNGVIDTIRVAGDVILVGARGDQTITQLDKDYRPSQEAPPLALDRLAWPSNSIPATCPRPRALDVSPDGASVVVGTFGCEVFTLPAKAGVIAQKGNNAVAPPEMLAQGHYAPKTKDTNEVWGLCLGQSQTRTEFVTVSDDATLRVWDYAMHRMSLTQDLNCHQDGTALPLDPRTRELSERAQARAVDICSDGSLCAVGYRSGEVKLFKTASDPWANFRTLSDASEWIEDLKFSPDGQWLAVASHDNRVYLYDTMQYKLARSLSVSSSFVSHIDWSACSQYLRTNDGSYEVFYFDLQAEDPANVQLRGGRHSTGGKKGNKDQAQPIGSIEWHTGTCVFTWGSQGIWQSGMDGSDINHCDVSSYKHRDGYRLIATGDDFGKVRIYRHPSMVENAKSVVLNGHCSHVTKVKFGPKGSNLLFSTGGNDTTVIQWRLEGI